MAKPATTPTWNTDGTNRVTPSAGEQATGFTLGGTIVGAPFNWLYFWLCQWVAYLGAQNFEGTTTVEDLAVTDDAVVGGDLTLVGGMYHGDRTFTMAIQSATFAGSGTMSNTITSNVIRTVLDTIGGEAHIRLPLATGDRLKSVKLYSTGSGTRPTVTIYTQATQGGIGAVSAATTNTDSTTLGGEFTRLATINAPATLTDETHHTVKVVAVTAGVSLYALRVTYDRPFA